MSTLEALNAISEAIEAHKILPDIQRQLKEAREAHDFAMLELDEARAEIEKLKMQRTEARAEIDRLANDVLALEGKVAELNDRNTNLDASVTDLLRQVETKTHDLCNKEQVINILSADKASLLLKLEDSKGVVAKLTDTLKNIGASIVAAVEVPEVTPSTPFPVADTVAMSDSPSDQSHDQSSPVSMEPVAEPTGEVVVNQPEFKIAEGTFPYRYW